MNYIHLEQELLSTANQFPKTIIYGCGKVGKKIYKVLKEYNIKVDCFAVSDAKGSPARVNDLEVKQISQLDLSSENTLLIIATSSSYHAPICSNLEQMNHSASTVYISDELYRKLAIKYRDPLDKLKFQVHLTEHCNLNCRGCYHFSSIAEEEYLDIDEYESDIHRLSELFDGEMDEALLLGGEPLLHPDIPKFLRITRKYFNTGTIKILSNGLPLLSMKDEFWEAAVDTDTQLWLTKYPISLNYDKLISCAREHGKEIQFFSNEPVRTLGHQPLDVEGKQDYLKNFTECYRANECITLDHGKMYTCIIPAYVRHFNKYFNKNLIVCKNDYVDIYQVKSKEELLNKLIQPMPFCRYCNRDEVAIFGTSPWEQSKCSIKEWTE